jgi:hypothetical protein
LTFNCFSTDLVFDVGDLVYTRGQKFCYFDRNRMGSIEFLRGQRLSAAGDGAAPRKTAQGPPLSDRSRSRVAFRPKKPADKLQMRPDERRHFQNAQMSEDRFCRGMAPLIRAYAAEGTRKPVDVSARLNREKYRTLDGQQWTPRLARLLLAKIFSGTIRRTGTPNGKSKGHFYPDDK